MSASSPTPHCLLPTPSFCLLTPPGRAAIAAIGVRGSQAAPFVARLFQPASGKPLSEFPLGRVIFGRFQTSATASEELVIGLIAPGELEIHCHGGKAAVEAICDALAAEGGTQITPATWARQQETDPLAAAALLALAEARTERTAAILLDQYRGALARELIAIDNALAKNDRATANAAIDQLLLRSDLGLHLTQPWKVVIAGRPNAGKSSLMNALLGYQRSIVWREPGTTRDVLTSATAIEGWPIELTDTAGLVGSAMPTSSSPDPIESEGIARARSQIAAADLILFVSDSTTPWDDDLHQEITRTAHSPLLIVHNKCDLAPPPADGRPSGIQISALTGHGIDELCQAIANTLVPAPPARDTALPFTTQQVAALQATAEQLQAGHISIARQNLAQLANR